MARSLAAGALAGLLALLAAACGGDPAPVEDDAYLAIICANLDAFSDAIHVETEEARIAAVIEEFIGELEGVAPPADLRGFHDAFIDYLREALDDPTSLLVLAPPLPSEEARERLAARERFVEACREPTFFSEPAADR